MKMNAKVYLMRSPDGMIKLGHSRDPEKRSKQIGKSIDVIHTTDVLEHAERIERLAHRVLALHGKHVRGEWFEATLEDAVGAIEIAIRQAEATELALGGRLAPQVVSDTENRTERFEMRMTARDLASLDRLRKVEQDLPTRAEMVRRLIERASDRKIRK